MKHREARPEAHHNASLRALIGHIEQEAERRRKARIVRAGEQAAAIRRQSRERAARLLLEARRRERLSADFRVAAEAARLEAVLRRRRLAAQQALAENGIAVLLEVLDGCWRAGAGARVAWLKTALEAAGRFAPTGDWRVTHPAGWDQAEAGVVLEAIRAQSPATSIAFCASEALAAGFRVRAGRVLVDATPAGLTARRARIVARLLAETVFGNGPRPA